MRETFLEENTSTKLSVSSKYFWGFAIKRQFNARGAIKLAAGFSSAFRLPLYTSMLHFFHCPLSFDCHLHVFRLPCLLDVICCHLAAVCMCYTAFSIVICMFGNQVGNVTCNTVTCNTIKCNTVTCNPVTCNTVTCNTVTCNTVTCNTVTCKTVTCNTVICNTVTCNTVTRNTGTCNTVTCMCYVLPCILDAICMCYTAYSIAICMCYTAYSIAICMCYSAFSIAICITESIACTNFQ